MIGALSVGVEGVGKVSTGRHRPGQNAVVRCFLVAVGGGGGDDDGNVVSGEGGGVGNTCVVVIFSLDGIVAIVET